MRNQFKFTRLVEIVSQKSCLIPFFSILFIYLFLKIGVTLLLYVSISIIFYRIGVWVGYYISFKVLKKIETIDLKLFSISLLSLGFYYFEAYKFSSLLTLLVCSGLFWLSSIFFILALYTKNINEKQEK